MQINIAYLHEAFKKQSIVASMYSFLKFTGVSSEVNVEFRAGQITNDYFHSFYSNQNLDGRKYVFCMEKFKIH